MVVGDLGTNVVGVAASSLCVRGARAIFKTHDNSGFENDSKDFGVFESGLLAAFVASDWPAAIIGREVTVVAALIAVVVWVIGSPLVFARVATLGAVFSFQPLDLLRRFGSRNV